jgi:hypothetical protein
MDLSIIDRLVESLSELAQTITAARQALAQRAAPPATILQRLDQYEVLLDKQRELASSLCRLCNHPGPQTDDSLPSDESMGSEQSGQTEGPAAPALWEDVARHVRLINGLSTMIRDDARDILASLSDSLGVASPTSRAVC